MLVGTRTVPLDAQAAVRKARLEHQEALDAMKRALNRDYIATANETIIDKLTRPIELVLPQHGCPDCGNRDKDHLLLGEGANEGYVTCTRCDYWYCID